MRADHAGVIDHRIEERVGAARRKEHGAAIGLDRAGVDGGSVERSLVNAHTDEAVADHVQADTITRSERHRAGTSHDHAIVAHLRAG